MSKLNQQLIYLKVITTELLCKDSRLTYLCKIRLKNHQHLPARWSSYLPQWEHVGSKAFFSLMKTNLQSAHIHLKEMIISNTAPKSQNNRVNIRVLVCCELRQPVFFFYFFNLLMWKWNNIRVHDHSFPVLKLRKWTKTKQRKRRDQYYKRPSLSFFLMVLTPLLADTYAL